MAVPCFIIGGHSTRGIRPQATRHRRDRVDEGDAVRPCRIETYAGWWLQHCWNHHYRWVNNYVILNPFANRLNVNYLVTVWLVCNEWRFTTGTEKRNCFYATLTSILCFHTDIGSFTTGSAFGPPFATSPLTAGTVFGLPGETGEANMFSFAASLLSLQLLQANKNLVRRHRHIFQHLFLTYQTQLSYQRDNGGFAMFTHSDAPASVW